MSSTYGQRRICGNSCDVRLFQWLANKDNYYSYRLVLCPEHLGTVFYLKTTLERNRLYLGGVFGEMMGTEGDIVVASSFKGNELIDRAFDKRRRQHQIIGF